MKILIAPDSFKHSLSAAKVGEALQRGILKTFPEAVIDVLPLADGGEGTVEAVTGATGGRIIKTRVHDPLMREIDAFFGVSGDGNTAIMEMASASGIELLSAGERNPWITTTYGTGELIRSALQTECTNIFIGIGGSATNDCGAGMATALGVRFFDGNMDPVPQGGGALGDVRHIDMGGLEPGIRDTGILVACDVTNPLTGPEGASYVYGPQKGADPGMVKKLDAGLDSFAKVIEDQLHLDVSKIPGAGAAGGLGAGMLAFLGARLVEGFPAVAEITGLEEHIRQADLVITGEGRLDSQTGSGKTPGGVARMAGRFKKPVVAVTGMLDAGEDVLDELGIYRVFPITDRPVPPDEAIRKTSSLLERTGEKIGNLLQSGDL